MTAASIVGCRLMSCQRAQTLIASTAVEIRYPGSVTCSGLPPFKPLHSLLPHENPPRAAHRLSKGNKYSRIYSRRRKVRRPQLKLERHNSPVVRQTFAQRSSATNFCHSIVEFFPVTPTLGKPLHPLGKTNLFPGKKDHLVAHAVSLRLRMICGYLRVI